MSMTVLEREKSKSSLVCLMQGLQGQTVTVELRDETILRGHVTIVDHNFNVQLDNAMLWSRFREEKAKNFEKFFLSGKLIRYVHIPDAVDPLKVMQRQIKALTPLEGKKLKDHFKKQMVKERRNRSVLAALHKQKQRSSK